MAKKKRRKQEMPEGKAEQFFRSLNIAVAKEPDELMDIISCRCGEEKTDAIMKAMYDTSEGDFSQRDARGIYSLIYSSLDSALGFEGGVSGDYFLNVMRWIEAHQMSLMASRTLDVGCGSGILTCFMASLFPTFSFTGIDHNRYAVRSAGKLAKQLHLTNVTFLQAEMDDESLGTFGTVICTNMMHDFLPPDMKHPDETQLIASAADSYKEVYLPYAKAVKARLSEHGKVFMVEEREDNPLLLAWALALNEVGLAPQINDTIVAKILDNVTPYEAIIAKQEEPMEQEALMAALIQHWYLGDEPLDLSATYKDYGACLVVALAAENLVEGYRICSENEVQGKYAVWTIRGKNDVFLLEMHVFSEEVTQAYFGTKADLAFMIKDMRRAVRGSMGNGLEAHRIVIEDGKEKDLPDTVSEEELFAADSVQ